MELETSGDISRTPAVYELADATVNIKNFTRLTTGIAIFSLNFLNVGLPAETTATAETPTTAAKVAVTTMPALSNPLLPPALSVSLFSSALSRAKLNQTADRITITQMTTTPLSFLVESSMAPSLQKNTTETLYATLLNGIANVISPTIIYSSFNGQLPNLTTAYVANTTLDAAGTTTSNRLLEHAPGLSYSSIVKVYVLSLMAFFSLLGNLMTMWNIYKTRSTRRNSHHSWSAIYSLIFHLSIADVLVACFCIIGEAAWSYTVQWIADEITCKLVKLFQMFSLYLSTYVLVLIGVDRWIAVKYPMKSLNMAKRCYRLLGGTYLLSLLLSLPQFFIFHVARGPFIEEFHQCVTHGFYTAKWQEQLYTTFTLVFTFILPLCILFGTYLSTFRTIASSEKMFQGAKPTTYARRPTIQTNRQRLIHKAKMKSLRISVVIIFAFLICWTPYYVMMITFMFWNPDKRFGENLQSAIFFFGMSNSLVNPLIYGAFHLCPMKRRASKYNRTHSLNRGDSQRTPSAALTAVAPFDSHGRQVRMYHPRYNRSQSNESSSTYKERVSLLHGTPTRSIVRKNTEPLLRSNGKATICCESPHATAAVLLNSNGDNSANSTIDPCSLDTLCMQEKLLGKHSTNAGGKSSDIEFSKKCHHTLVTGTNEDISSV